MKKGSIILVDSNMLNSEELVTYFSESKHNKIVLPDYIAIEAHKSSNPESIIDSMETVSKYPQQVMILHGTRTVTRMKHDAGILKWKFINQELTKVFEEYCDDLKLAQAGHVMSKMVMAHNAAVANDVMKAVLKGSTELTLSFQDIEENVFTPNEIEIIRKVISSEKRTLSFTPTMMSKIYSMVEMLANGEYLKHPDHKRPPRTGINSHCFLFRYFVATAFLGIRWIGRGSNHKVKAQRMQNDLIDAMLVAYSTYYDGLLTNDQGMQWLKVMTDKFLELAPYKSKRNYNS